MRHTLLHLIIRYLKGYVKIQIQGDSTERFLNLCSFHEICIWELNPIGHTYEMCIPLKDFYKLKPLLKKTNTHLTITEKNGFPFWADKNRRRKLYFASIVCCTILLYGFSNYIWDIHFVGNETRTSEVLLDFLYDYEVKPGMKKKEVDCEQIAKDIRAEFDDIVWVSASIDGSLLTIHVRENDDLLQDEKITETSDEKISDLVAQKDAVIKEIITRNGIPMVHAGDSVKAGDILVSGRIEVINDSGEVIDYQYESADAYISGITTQEYTDHISLKYEKKVYDKKNIRKGFFVQIGCYEIQFGKFFDENEKENLEMTSWKKQLKFGESMYLPIYFGKIQQKIYTLKEAEYTKEEIRSILSSNFSRFCDNLAKKGVQITENNVKILIDQNQAAATGSLSLVEPLGEPADTEILMIERNETDESFRNNH